MGKSVKIDISENLVRNADELDRLAQSLWDAGLAMAGTLIAAAALSVRDAAGGATRAGASLGAVPGQNRPPGGDGTTVH